jgi:phosphatidylinositol kinase/protein kinase (PI-3  family)
MQLFGLINICLDNDRITSNRGLSIVRYSVLPLSNNSVRATLHPPDLT